MKATVVLPLLALLGCATTGDSTAGTGSGAAASTPPTTNEPGGTGAGTETGPGTPVAPGGAGGETGGPGSTGTSPGGTVPPEGGPTGIPGGTGAGGDTYGGQAGTGVGGSGGRASRGITSQDAGDMTDQRREFRSEMGSRLQRIEDRVRALESQGGTVNRVQLRDLRDQHRMLQSQLGAVDEMSDDAWFRARDEITEDLAALERRVADLDNQG